MQAIPAEERDKVAFVFFDNEEIGLIGSSLFKKRYRSETAHKLLVNFDCVSDGDHFLFVSKKRAIHSHSEEYALLKCIIEEEAPVFNKQAEFVNTTQAFFPSDQFIFPKGIGVISLNKAPIIGLYIDRIHTSRDTRFDKNNLTFLTQSLTKFVSQV